MTAGSIGGVRAYPTFPPMWLLGSSILECRRTFPFEVVPFVAVGLTLSGILKDATFLTFAGAAPPDGLRGGNDILELEIIKESHSFGCGEFATSSSVSLSLLFVDETGT